MTSFELPTELLEVVVLEFWYSEHSSKDRITFMKACPLINNLWKEVFARISSRDVYIPTVAYLVYLSTIIRTNSSAIYCSGLPHSVRSITCHVDLTETTKDAAMEPYSVLASLPNHSGFRRCFKNIQRINFEVNYRIRGGWHESILCNEQLIRTRISIALDKVATKLSVLPVDWHIIAEKPEVDHIRGVVDDVHWDIFLREATLAIAPGMLCCIRKEPFKETVLNSSYVDGLLHFRGRALLVEKMGDARRINYYFRKAAPKPPGLWTLIGEIFEDTTGALIPPGSVYSCWKTILGEVSVQRKL
ncbi:uncharacterized protein EV420DRAFT_557424 [Desarmillaria tabescens]|uniref:Uncharacterized protein n=1 Tax=Armillaria tabescens TaxID=1929756 RepID=A0AA39N2N3_ARMTA|nr:uncharacterized protein EV420DRAFT_557424 [Desarmillaria tabescens]KAK0455717.1 hypothetical protein EV420DRAFT_557424 [Desarmillaria tabescens]